MYSNVPCRYVHFNMMCIYLYQERKTRIEESPRWPDVSHPVRYPAESQGQAQLQDYRSDSLEIPDIVYFYAKIYHVTG